MGVLLDTNIVIDCLRRAPSALAWLGSLEERASISAITLLELYAGTRSQREENDVVVIRQTLSCLPINEDIGRRSGSFLRHFGSSHGMDIPDALIAATAEHHGLRLATRNVKHFPMFPRLKPPY
jgi:predicted nucleic acid-binding protein